MSTENEKVWRINQEHNYSLWETSMLSVGQFWDMSLVSRMEYLLKFGCTAPSTHNTQPWSFIWDDSTEEMCVCLAGERVLPASDPKGRQAVMSVGAFAANLSIASEVYGAKLRVTTYEVDADEVRPLSVKEKVPLLSISLEGQEIPSRDSRDLMAMLSRRVNRTKDYDQTDVFPENLLQELQQLPREGVGLHLLRRGSRSLFMLAQLQGMIDGFVGNSPGFARELGVWMKESGTEDYFGMPISTFLLDDDFGKEVISSLRGITPHNPSHIAGVARSSREGILNASLVGMVTVVKQDVPHWLRAGSLMAELGVLLEKNGYATAYFAGIAEASDLQLLVVSTMITTLLHHDFSTTDEPVGLFRSGIGTGKLPPHSPRAPLHLLLSERAQ